jgi:hypothetical protein
MSEGKIKVYDRRLSNREIADLLPLSAERQRERDMMKTIVDEQCRVSSVCRELREQRDRLAEVLNDLWHHYSLTGAAYELIEKALAEVKGGSHDH